MSDLPLNQLEQLVQGHHWDPLAILVSIDSPGRFPTVAIRCFLPEAHDVALLLSERVDSPFP